MKLLERFGKKTVQEVVDTAASTVNQAMKNVAEDKVQAFIRVLPVLISVYLLFHGDGGNDDSRKIYIIHNHFEGAMQDAQDDC